MLGVSLRDRIRPEDLLPRRTRVRHIAQRAKLKWKLHRWTLGFHVTAMATPHSENAKFYPVCNPEYDNYFNMTWTYRLDSDIRGPFIRILGRNGVVVGPEINMKWVNSIKPVSKEVLGKIKRKNKAVALFKSYCMTQKYRTQEFVRSLNASLVRNKLKLDIYGWFGNKKCSRGIIEECLMVLRKNYYFYLAFENSLSEDNVSEKILYPLQNCAVPIVYGGADYSR
ncbi:jg6155 [Pararge aegeria aegeria]|uniref:Fucosyltransferase n=1 Tax=Pararge aegeria aegeria TaxID=348720 RepID=A0A8S4RD92_9NEOP|nr:jg6155 [Pararge aegeria aegeria]